MDERLRIALSIVAAFIGGEVTGMMLILRLRPPTLPKLPPRHASPRPSNVIPFAPRVGRE